MWKLLRLWMTAQLTGWVVRSIKHVVQQLGIEVQVLEQVWEATRDMLTGLCEVEMMDLILWGIGEREWTRWTVRATATISLVTIWLKKIRRIRG